MAKADSKNAKKVALPQSYTVSSMAAYLAESKELSKKDAKEILELVFNLIETGVLKGERVPIGKIGKVYAKVKPATKARKGRNPITGEEITIPAKKATKVPKFTFTKGFKEEVLKAKIKTKK
ncbi:MAG TPA: HU family DNA-binding protein [Spirochaetota bacterium]|nr:HU family DNA-binding protein [Spirochaetota bacterium]HPJ33696.1 HU family DNA-binding protein [Spirochaetota bacterium]